MSTYVGNQPKYLNVPIYTATGNGTTTAHTLTWTPGTVNTVIVFLSGVQQRPTTDYTISGTTLTFTSAPPNGVNITVVGLAMGALYKPADNTVETISIQDGAVTVPKLNAGFILPIANGGTGATNLNSVSTGGNLYLAANFGGF
jgi:hypothetical protein